MVFARVFLPYILLTFFPCFLEDDKTPSSYPANEWNVVFGARYKQGIADPCNTIDCIDATIHRGKRKLCVL